MRVPSGPGSDAATRARLLAEARAELAVAKERRKERRKGVGAGQVS